MLNIVMEHFHFLHMYSNLHRKQPEGEATVEGFIRITGRSLEHFST